DLPQGAGTYPNIRGSLFVLPLWRVGNVTDDYMETGRLDHQHVPWTANFNNWGNLALDNDRDPSNGYTFMPGQDMLAKTVGGVSYPFIPAAKTANQMLSEQDFATMMTHMRLRGANSVHLLDSGNVDVSRQQMEDDAHAGWLGEATVNAILAAADRRLLIGTEPIPTSYYSDGEYSGGSVAWVDGQE